MWITLPLDLLGGARAMLLRSLYAMSFMWDELYGEVCL